MRIGLNALGLKNKTGGVETYIYNIVKAILLNDNNNYYYLFVGKNTQKIFKDLNFKNLKIIVLPINTNNSIVRVIAENSLLNLYCLWFNIKLVHHFCNYIPRIFYTKSIVTIHDLGGFFYHEKYPEYEDMHKYYDYMKKELAYTLKKAYRVIAISNFTKSEILKYYPQINAEKIDVIGQSLDTRKNKEIVSNIDLKQLEIDKPYILSVSVIRPHKNMTILIEMFNKIKEKYGIPHLLVIAGGIQLKTNDFIEAINTSPYKKDIKYLGYVNNDVLPVLYKNTSCFVFPSLYEGFGIPLLEAMEYHIPILSSNCASLPEVGGDGCLYFKPEEILHTVEQLYQILIDKNIGLKFFGKQKKQLEIFNWNNIAEEILKTYKKGILSNEN